VNSPARSANKKAFEQLFEFRFQMRRFKRFFGKSRPAEGVTPLQYLLMLHIKGYPCCKWATVGELAERLQAHHHGVVALVTCSEALGLVCRTASEIDRRRVEIRLEQSGEQL